MKKEKIWSLSLYTTLAILLIVFFLYLFSPFFRCLLTYNKIDPNFIIVFLTSISIILSFIGIKNSEKNIKKEREYIYNLDLNNKTKEKVEVVIGKLFTIMNQSDIFLSTMKNINFVLEKSDNTIFKDSNNVSSKDYAKSNIEAVGAYIILYFGNYIQNQWNDMNDALGKLHTNCINLLDNYNLYVETKSINESLKKRSSILLESDNLNKKIYNLTEEMKNILLDIVKENDKEIKRIYLDSK